MKKLYCLLFAFFLLSNSFANIAPIHGPDAICAGSSASFLDSTIGGVWSSSDTTVATVNLTGIVTGITAGTVIITYQIDTSYVTDTVVVKLPPSPIMNLGWMCQGPGQDYGSAILVDQTLYGTWTSSRPDTAVVNASEGLVTAGPGFWSPGFWCDTVTITYTLANGCYTSLLIDICICDGSVSAIANTNEISLFPNPATTSLTIQSTNEPIRQVSITNIMGQTVHQQTAPANCELLQVDVSSLPDGVYFVKVNGSEVRKFVKE